MKKLLVSAFAAALMMLAGAAAHAEVVKFTVAQAVNANGSVTPTLTWCTEQVQSSSPTTCAGSAPASGCSASGGWTGVKAAQGTETLVSVTTTTSYTLQCTWPGSDSFTVKWVAPTTNTDGSALTDLAGFKVYYSTSSSMSQNQIKTAASGATSVVIGPGLAPATYYVVVSAVNAPGAESVKAPSPPATRVVSSGNTITQTVKVAFPNQVTNVTTE